MRLGEYLKENDVWKRLFKFINDLMTFADKTKDTPMLVIAKILIELLLELSNIEIYDLKIPQEKS